MDDVKNSKLPFMQTIPYLPLWLLCFTPLLFFPYLLEPFELPKLAWVVILTTVSISLQFILAVITQKLKITLSFTTLATGTLAAASLLSSIFASKNLAEAFLTPLGPTLWILLFHFSLFRPAYHEQNTRHIPGLLLPLSLIGVASFAVLSRLGLIQKLFPTIPFFSNPFFTPSGIAITVLSLFIFAIAFLSVKAFESYKKHHTITFQLIIVGIALLIIGAISHGSFIAKDIITSRFGIRDNWAIMAKTLSNPVSTFIGIGPQNYLSAFTQYRPASMNNTTIWNTRASVAGGLFYHITTTLGLGGLIGLIFIAVSLLAFKHPLQQLPGYILILSFFLVPPNLPLIITLYIAMYINDSKYKLLHISISKYIKKVQVPISITLFCVALSMVIIAGYILLSDHTVYKSNAKLTENKLDEAYSHAKQSVTMIPYSSLYRRNLSRIEALTAFSLIEQLNKEASGSAKQQEYANQASQFLQQAIADGQAATVLAPLNVETWEQLASVYTRVIGIAENANSWAISSYQQVVKLDPTNPISRFRLGTVYAVSGDTDQAISHFLRAIELKNDYADPYIGLAQIYASRGQKEKTLQAVELGLKYLPEGEFKKQLESEKQKLLEGGTPSPTTSPQPNTLPLDLPPAATNAARPKPTSIPVTPEPVVQVTTTPTSTPNELNPSL